MALLTLSLVAHHRDNGDGSSTVALFNDISELKLDLEESGDTTIEDIESGDDPYEHGTLSYPEITIDTDTGRLIDPVYLSSDG